MMKSHNDIDGLEIFGKGTISDTLPSGYVDPSGVVHRDVVVREMTGYEEDILEDNDLEVTERISRVLVNCIEKLGTITDKATIEAAVRDSLPEGKGLPITAQDRIAAMLFIRRASLGNIYKFERKCPGCSTVAKNRNVDLTQLNIKALNDPTKRKVKITLGRSKKEAILKVLSAKGEAKVAALKIDQKQLKTYAIMARLESLDGKPVTGSKEDIDTISKLSKADRTQLMDVYQLMEGDIDTMVQVQCKNPECKIKEFEFPIDVGQLFFSSQVEKPSPAALTWL